MIKCVRAKTRALLFKLRLAHNLRLNFACASLRRAISPSHSQTLSLATSGAQYLLKSRFGILEFGILEFGIWNSRIP